MVPAATPDSILHMDALFAILLLSAKIRRSRRLREEMLGSATRGGRRGNRRVKADGSIEVSITTVDELYNFIRTGTA